MWDANWGESVMADRHEDNWQPVRPLDDDVPEDHAAPPTGSEPIAVAATTEATPTPPREPFRSTPITMPPESISNPPTPQSETAPTPAPRASRPKDPSGPVEGDGKDAGVAATPAEEGKTATATPTTPVQAPKAPVAPTVKPTPPHTPPEASPPVASAPPPPQGPMPSGPVPSGPVPQNSAPQNWAAQNSAPQNWAPQNSVPQNWAPQNPGPQNQWASHNQLAPQNQAGPQHNWAPQNHGDPQQHSVAEGQWHTQNQWNPQTQWGPQPGQWPGQQHPNQPHPGQPQQLRHAPGDAMVVAPAPAAFDQSRSAEQHVSSLDLGSSLLVRSGNAPPLGGWRRALYLMTGGRVDVGNSAAQQRRSALTAQVDRPLVGCHRVAVLSLKGGVGKTTTTATLGSTFAEIRGDRVIAIDANPDRGTLGQKVPLETTSTVRNLLRDIQSLDRYSDVRAYTSQNVHRLEVLASDSDPAASEAFSGEDYDRAVSLLEKFYSIVITDCGTGLMHSAMERILEGADTLVVVSSGSVDGVRSASATLDWLDAHGYRELVATSVAVVNGVRQRAGKVDLQKVVEHFEQRCARVRTIPFDPHLEEGAEIELDRLRGRTRKALLEVAAAVAAGFPDAPTAAQRN